MPRLLAPWLALGAFLGYAVELRAQADAEHPPANGLPLLPPSTAYVDRALPPPDGHDWIQLKTGEWLRGEVLGLRDRELEFDSDRLKKQTIKFKYVTRMYIRSPTTFVLSSLDVLDGPARFVDGQLVVWTAQGSRTATRDELLAMIPTADGEIDFWELEVSLGLNMARGNVEQTVFNASADIAREDHVTSLAIAYLGNLAASRGSTTAHSHRGTEKLDLYLSDVFYLTPALTTVEFDEFKNLRLRATVAGGAGFRVIDTKDVEWKIGLVGGYQSVRYESVAEGEDPLRRNAAVAIASGFELDVTSDVDLETQYIGMLVPTDLGLSTQHLLVELEVDITKVIDIELRFIYDRTEEPVADEDGDVPKSDDLSFIASIGIDLE